MCESKKFARECTYYNSVQDQSVWGPVLATSLRIKTEFSKVMMTGIKGKIYSGGMTFFWTVSWIKTNIIFIKTIILHLAFETSWGTVINTWINVHIWLSSAFQLFYRTQIYFPCSLRGGDLLFKNLREACVHLHRSILVALHFPWLTLWNGPQGVPTDEWVAWQLLHLGSTGLNIFSMSATSLPVLQLTIWELLLISKHLVCFWMWEQSSLLVLSAFGVWHFRWYIPFPWLAHSKYASSCFVCRWG